jgi:hypothetical protein
MCIGPVLEAVRHVSDASAEASSFKSKSVMHLTRLSIDRLSRD